MPQVDIDVVLPLHTFFCDKLSLLKTSFADDRFTEQDIFLPSNSDCTIHKLSLTADVVVLSK